MRRLCESTQSTPTSSRRGDVPQVLTTGSIFTPTLSPIRRHSDTVGDGFGFEEPFLTPDSLAAEQSRQTRARALLRAKLRPTFVCPAVGTISRPRRSCPAESGRRLTIAPRTGLHFMPANCSMDE